MEVYGLQEDFGIACLLLWFDLWTHEPGGVPPLSGLSLEWSQMYTESLHNEGTKTVRDTRLVLYSPVVRVLRL